MGSLHLEDVPDDVVERLQRLAAASGTPLSEFVVGELTVLCRPDRNAELLAALPDLEADVQDLLADLRADRER